MQRIRDLQGFTLTVRMVDSFTSFMNQDRFNVDSCQAQIGLNSYLNSYPKAISFGLLPGTLIKDNDSSTRRLEEQVQSTE